jgi:hypothetical protein
MLKFFFPEMWLDLSPRGRSVTIWQPRMIMRMKHLVERELTGGTEILAENLPQCHFIHHKSHMTRAAGVGSRWLTVWTMAWPLTIPNPWDKKKNVSKFSLGFEIYITHLLGYWDQNDCWLLQVCCCSKSRCDWNLVCFDAVGTVVVQSVHSDLSPYPAVVIQGTENSLRFRWEKIRTNRTGSGCSRTTCEYLHLQI